MFFILGWLFLAKLENSSHDTESIFPYF